MVNLEKIQAAFDKISSNPILLEGLNTEMNKMVEQLGIQLDIDERFVLLSKLAEQRSPVSAFGKPFGWQTCACKISKCS